MPVRAGRDLVEFVEENDEFGSMVGGLWGRQKAI